MQGFEHLMSNLGLGGIEANEDHDIDAHIKDDKFNDIHHDLGLHNDKHEHMIHERSIGEPILGYVQNKYECTLK